jgi:predicted dehydrogenase
MLGVGIIGAGPGAASLHGPTLARAGGFRLVHVSDDGSGRAREIADVTGARASEGIGELLADPDVDVVVVCSPPERHAEHVRAAVAAGKRAILCEKPLALTDSDAEDIVNRCRAAGVVLVVGTNHFFDPAWARAKHHLVSGGGRIRAITITASLPPNDRYHRMVSEPTGSRTAPGRGLPDLGDPHVAAAVVGRLVSGLAVHDLPALRDLVPRIDRVVHAAPVAPLGYSIGLRAGDVSVQLVATMRPTGADALWRLTIATTHDVVEVAFEPSFVHSGSASVRVRSADGTETVYPRLADDGYTAEWQALAAALSGGEPVEYDELLDDARYAIALTDAVAAVIRDGAVA